MNPYLADEGLDELMQKASSMTPVEFNDYLDDITGVKSSLAVGDKEGAAAKALHFSPGAFREHLSSQDVGQLSVAMQAGCVMDQVLACLRLLRIPKSQLPPAMEGAAQTSPASPDYIMSVAQRHLSKLLVEYPVLMHNRIYVPVHHFTNAELGPIASIIAHTPGAEFPRTQHGVPADKMRVFARHHCVHTGLTKAAPKLPGSGSPDLQGATLLGSFSNTFAVQPRPGMLTSVLELDDHRASGLPTSRRPASFLSCKGQTLESLRASIGNSLLGAFGITALKTDTRFDPADLLRVLKTSGFTKEAWLLRRLEATLFRWMTLPADQVGPAFKGLASALRELRPYGLGPADLEVQPRALMQWMTHAVLDSSSARAVSIGATFKSFPVVDSERAMALLAAIDAIGIEAGEDPELLPQLVERALGDLIGDPPEVWRAALRQHRMLQVINTGDRTRNGLAAPGTPDTPDTPAAPGSRSPSSAVAAARASMHARAPAPTPERRSRAV